MTSLKLCRMYPCGSEFIRDAIVDTNLLWHLDRPLANEFAPTESCPWLATGVFDARGRIQS